MKKVLTVMVVMVIVCGANVLAQDWDLEPMVRATEAPTAAATDTPVPTFTPTVTPVPPTETPIPEPTLSPDEEGNKMAEADTPVPATDTPVPPTDTPTVQAEVSNTDKYQELSEADPVETPEPVEDERWSISDVKESATTLNRGEIHQLKMAKKVYCHFKIEKKGDFSMVIAHDPESKPLKTMQFQSRIISTDLMKLEGEIHPEMGEIYLPGIEDLPRGNYYLQLEWEEVGPDFKIKWLMEGDKDPEATPAPKKPASKKPAKPKSTAKKAASAPASAKISTGESGSEETELVWTGEIDLELPDSMSAELSDDEEYLLIHWQNIVFRVAIEKFETGKADDMEFTRSYTKIVVTWNDDIYEVDARDLDPDKIYEIDLE
ncbi:hypothetical protein ACFL2B_03115 [Patescibacteria group bacterium]